MSAVADNNNRVALFVVLFYYPLASKDFRAGGIDNLGSRLPEHFIG